MPAVCFHEVQHRVKLFIGYLFKHDFVAFLKLFVQFLVNFINDFSLLGKPEIDFFLVKRLLIAFDKLY